MTRSAVRRIPRWKQAVAIACLLYAALAWALPVFMLPFVNVLPFEHERTFLERLPLSVLGSTFMVLALVVINGGRLRGGPVSGSAGQKLRHWAGVVGGLTMFTLLGAELSPNLLGSFTKTLPGEPFASRTSIEAVEYSGSRYKSVKLEYRDARTSGPRYLVLSKRLFDYPVLRPGDVVELRGRETVVGRYVDHVALVR